MSPARRGGRALGAAVIATWAATVVVGCGSPATYSAAAGKAAPPFAEQLRAVREGESDRIEVAASPGPDDWESLRGLAGLRVLVLGRGVAGDASSFSRHSTTWHPPEHQNSLLANVVVQRELQSCDVMAPTRTPERRAPTFSGAATSADN